MEQLKLTDIDDENTEDTQKTILYARDRNNDERGRIKNCIEHARDELGHKITDDDENKLVDLEGNPSKTVKVNANKTLATITDAAGTYPSGIEYAFIFDTIRRHHVGLTVNITLSVSIFCQF